MNTQRPLSVAIAVVLLALLSLLYLIFPLLPTEGVPTLVVYSNVVWGVAGLAVAAGLWMLRRWSMRLAIVLFLCVLAILSASPGLTAASSALLGVLATVVVAGAVLIILLVVLPSSQRAYA